VDWFVKNNNDVNARYAPHPIPQLPLFFNLLHFNLPRLELLTQQAHTGCIPGSQLGCATIKKHWESAHENADCFEVRNLQILGMATPQDEIQEQKETYALRRHQERNLEWRQAHANTVRAGQDKRARLPMMPRVPIKPPDGVPTDEQYYGNMEGVITMRFKGERLAKIAA
jgi:hypothetical protein